jgi:hypothetical protein
MLPLLVALLVSPAGPYWTTQDVRQLSQLEKKRPRFVFVVKKLFVPDRQIFCFAAGVRQLLKF